MRCDGCGEDISPLTTVCPNCGLDYAELNKDLIEEGRWA